MGIKRAANLITLLNPYLVSVAETLNCHPELVSGSLNPLSYKILKQVQNDTFYLFFSFPQQILLNKTRRKEIPLVLKEKWDYDRQVSFVDHHLAHCASAYFTSGMDKALVISLDGAGDFSCSHIYTVEDGNFVKLNELDSYDSIGNYYAYVTHICGFQAHKHEGKITGLAAYGKPNYSNLFNRLIKYEVI